jgi:hypothetical protein
MLYADGTRILTAGRGLLTTTTMLALFVSADMPQQRKDGIRVELARGHSPEPQRSGSE